MKASHPESGRQQTPTSSARRRFLRSTAACLIAAPAVLRVTRLHAAEFTMKAANNSPVTHPLTVHMAAAMDAIRKETNGAVDIQMFPNNQLGSDTDMLSQVRSGALEFFTVSGLILSTLVSTTSINGLGFIWSNYDNIWPAMDGELGAYIRGQVDKAGLVAFQHIFDNGFRQVTSSGRQIKNPDDLKGFKIRVPPSPLYSSLFKAFEAAPTTINFSETYSALQTKVAEGQENPLAIIEAGKLYEVQKYLAKTNHIWDGFWFLANGKVWKSLPKDVQAVISQKVNEAALSQRKDIFEQNASLERTLSTQGLVFSEVDSAAFRSRLESVGFYREWKAKFGNEAWTLLEKYVGQIA